MELTRREGKALTRRRLLDAALQILDQEGEGALTTTRVTTLAGIAQSSFYVHFADMDDLLHNLIDELAAERRRQTREARQVALAAPVDHERFRDTFRVPMRHYAAHPPLFRLLVRSRLDPTSLIGTWSRAVWADTREALVDDLAASGFPATTPAERRRAEMVAEGIMTLTETLVLGHLDGRYPDLEEAIDVLEAFSLGYFTLYHPELEPGFVVSAAAERLGWPTAEKDATSRRRSTRQR